MTSVFKAIRQLICSVISVCLVFAGTLNPVSGQAQGATITPNYKDADIRQIIEAVGEVTGRNFVIDPRVTAKVTMLSTTPMSPDAFYEAFLSILAVYGFVAVPSGDVIKILPDANARQMPGWESMAGGQRPDDIVTQVVPVRNVAAAQLVPILRPLIPQYGHLAAHPASNLLIISDRAANVDRVLRIVRRIDQESDEDYEVIRLEHASAGETVRVVTALQQGARAAGGGPTTTVVADERTNSVLISGDKSERLRIRTLVTHLDTPLEQGGDTRVRYLRYASAEDLATKLDAQYSIAAGAQANGSVVDVTIWADEQTNALVITAPPKTMRSMMSVIDRLDIRRAQVLIETIIVEVGVDKAAEFGITWAVLDDDTAVGATTFPIVPGGVTDLISASGTPEGAAAAIQPGITGAVGRLSDSGLSFAAVIRALQSDANNNIMATPTLVTMDNEEAQIQVGQEVPFVTGSFTTPVAGGATVNPFTTVEREQVGLTLKITPQINEGDAVLLKIEQEISTLTDSTQAVDLITNNRTITTTVIVEDGGTLVIGGLIQDDVRESEQRVPVLSSIPLLGVLFRAKKVQYVKTNLMFFIKPTIIRDSVDAAFETNAKYSLIRDIQLGVDRDIGLLKGDQLRPLLPELEQSGQPTPVLDLRGLTPSDAGGDADQADGNTDTAAPEY
jgi:general secretion pathway protein D